MTERGPERGFIVPIGGAESKLRDPVILRRFVDVCGGDDARLVIIPTASSLPDTGPKYVRLFEELGVGHVKSLPFDSRQDCEREDWLQELREADGVFMTGGNQLRLSTTIGGTSVAELLRQRNAEGMHVAGTSAGAAFLSAYMIAFGDEGGTPRSDMVTLAPGLGMTQEFIVDQHFRQRDRLGRLLAAISYNPKAIGVGLDEDTAAFLGPDHVLEVVGSGGITIVDPAGLQYSSMDSAHRHDPVCVIGLHLHVLVDGGKFDIGTRKATPVEAVNANE